MRLFLRCQSVPALRNLDRTLLRARTKGRTLSCLEGEGSQEAKVRPHLLTQIKTALPLFLGLKLGRLSASVWSLCAPSSGTEVDPRQIRENLLLQHEGEAPSKWVLWVPQSMWSEGPGPAKAGCKTESVAEPERNVYSSRLGA